MRALTPEFANDVHTFYADVGVFAVAIVAAIITLVFLRGKVGYALLAMREDEPAAQAIGIHVTRATS